MTLKVVNVGRTSYSKGLQRNGLNHQKPLEKQANARKLGFIDEYPQCEDSHEIPDYDYDFNRKPTIVDKVGDFILESLGALTEIFEKKKK